MWMSFFFIFVCLVFGGKVGKVGKVKVVCQIPSFSSYWEKDWLMELLDGRDVCWIDDNGKFEAVVNNSIVVLSGFCNFEYFKKLKNLHYRFGVIQLSDENYKLSTEYYDDTQFVFRNYWHEKFEKNSKVVIFPLGYNKGFWAEPYKERNYCSGRKYVWSFSGWVKSNKDRRMDMISQMKNIPQFRLIETSRFGNFDNSSLSTTDYRNLLLDTIFIPCPAGGNHETFRVWEALECGCIPVVEKFPKDYYRLYLGNHPFLAVDSWHQAVIQIRHLLSKPKKIKALQLKCQSWWQSYKNDIKTQMENVIRNSFSE